MAKFDSILGTVGNTPVVKINKLGPKGINLYVKIEAFNPLGSVKDRLALGVIEAAEKSGALKPGQTVIEATSGNTGIGLAMVCAAKGYPLVVTMAETFSVERRKLMRFLGAKVVLTPAAGRGMGMVEKGRRTRQDARLVPHAPVRERGQPRHAFAHHGARDRRRLQGRETRLLGHRLRHRRHAQGRRARASQGAARHQDRAVRAGRRADARPATRRRNAMPTARPPNPSRVQAAPDAGLAPDFIPKLTGDAVDSGVISRIITIAGADAMKCSKALAQQEGIFVGITAGATFCSPTLAPTWMRRS